jgi:hypothetical protein
MNQQKSEQEWNQLRLRINGLFDRFLKEDVPAIEHKSNVTALLQAPMENMNGREMEKAT